MSEADVRSKFTIIREEFPAIFEFNGRFLEEDYDVDQDLQSFVEVPREHVERVTGIRDWDTIVRDRRVEWAQARANSGD